MNQGSKSSQKSFALSRQDEGAKKSGANCSATPFCLGEREEIEQDFIVEWQLDNMCSYEKEDRGYFR